MCQFIFYLFVPMEYVAHKVSTLASFDEVHLTFSNWSIKTLERENTGDFRDPSTFPPHSHLV